MVASTEAVRRGFDLKFYPNPKAVYHPEDDKWTVYYTREPNRHPGDFFSITVSDKTRRTKFYGGL
jgi:hypothetical protein